MTRSVSDVRSSTTDPEMSVIGYVVGIGSMLLLIPVLPFIAILWVIDRLTGESRREEAADRMRSTRSES